MEELKSGDVQIYKFPVGDEKEADLNSSMNVSRDITMYQPDVLFYARCLIKSNPISTRCCAKIKS